jgi:hypothetical protein
MRKVLGGLTPERLKLLRRLHDINAAERAQFPLYLDDLTAFARFDLIEMDGTGEVRFTDKCERMLAL